jgi:hypothetical protein
MKLKFLSLQIESEDYLIPNSQNSEFPFRVANIVSDFSFQTEFIYNFIGRKLSLLKVETDNFQFISIRGRKKPKETIFIKEIFKALEIEIEFNENRYLELYPFENEYPLINKLLQPVLNENEFNEFLFEMITKGLNKAKKQDVPIPNKLIEEFLFDFKSDGYKNEWIEKTKTFKEYGLKAIFLCKMNCNYFTLTLIINKNKKEILKEEILKTLPSSLIFKWQFKDIFIIHNKIVVIKDDSEQTILFEKSLKDIL